MKKKDIYDITIDEVCEIIDAYNCRFCSAMKERKERLRDKYEIVPSWIQFKAGMRVRGKLSLLNEIEELDNEYLLEEIKESVVDSYLNEDSERLKIAQMALSALNNREKLASGESGDGSQPINMTINVKGVKGISSGGEK
jgi:hypothetical protein